MRVESPGYVNDLKHRTVPFHCAALMHGHLHARFYVGPPFGEERLNADDAFLSRVETLAVLKEDATIVQFRLALIDVPYVPVRAVWDCPDSVDRLTTLPSATSVLGAHTPLG